MNNIYSKMVKKATLSSPKRRLKITQAVIAVHLAVIFLLLSYFLLTDYLSKLKKKDVVVVRLVEIPKEVTARTVKKPGTRRRSIQKPKKKTVKKKKVTAPTAEPKFTKPAVKKTPQKKVQKTVPKNTVSKRSVNTAKKVQPKPKYVPPSVPDDLEIIKPEDLKRVPVPEENTEDDNDDEVGATYAEQLVGVIYKLWNPPSSQLLNGRNPKVYLKIRMNRYGRVLKAEITRRSGFLPMDRSADELIRNLKQLPPPPPGEPTEIEFVLVPQE